MTKEQPIDKAISRGSEMAKERNKSKFWSHEAWGGRWFSQYSISDNPYDRKNCKSEHVAWHNSFYLTRKEMNRGVK